MSHQEEDITAAELPVTNSPLFFDELGIGVTGTIIVMICRVWDVNSVMGRYLSTDFVVSDSKGQSIHCTARNNIAHNFVKLKEGSIYSIKNFVVVPNKDEYRIVKMNSYMLEFDGTTTATKASVKVEGFDRYAFHLEDFSTVAPTDNKYLIDVVGYVTNVGRSNQQKTGSRTLDFYLANQSGHSIRVTLWGTLGDVLIEKKTNQNGLCPVVLTSLNVKLYKNKVYLSSSSSTVIYDGPEIPAIQALKAEMSPVELSKAALPVDHAIPKDGTLENLILWARNRKDNPSTFNCKATIDGVRTRKGWNFPTCGDIKCKKGATRKGGQFWCESCERTIAYPVLRYRLELEVSDGTAHTVIVLFDESSTELVGFPVGSIVDSDEEASEEHPNLPKAIANLIGTTHVFQLKSNSYYQHGTFESFTCWKLNSSKPVDADTSSSTAPESPSVKRARLNKLSGEPAVMTPVKQKEDKKEKRFQLEDSEFEGTSPLDSDLNSADDESPPEKNKHKRSAGKNSYPDSE